MYLINVTLFAKVIYFWMDKFDEVFWCRDKIGRNYFFWSRTTIKARDQGSWLKT